MSPAVVKYRPFRRTFRRVTTAVSVTTSATHILSAQTAPICTPYPVVDLRTASIAGVPVDTTISFIRAQIGSPNIRRYTVASETGPMSVYTLRICGHNIEWYDYGASWSDSVYRTKENLGVGSTLKAFDATLGLGKISADHGLQVKYELEHYNLYVEVGECYTIGPQSTVDRSCRVNGMALEEGYPTTSPKPDSDPPPETGSAGED
jgi:hypothetical protein